MHGTYGNAEYFSQLLLSKASFLAQFADIITEITGSEDVAVTIVGCHSCMSARGIRKEQAKTFTTELRGQFRENPNLMFYLK